MVAIVSQGSSTYNDHLLMPFQKENKPSHSYLFRPMNYFSSHSSLPYLFRVSYFIYSVSLLTIQPPLCYRLAYSLPFMQVFMDGKPRESAEYTPQRRPSLPSHSAAT